ncbi:MAG: C10 family peptidase [Bacteroidaceae bacterium]|nr:C10 family peptidase [Bacteroidaceae bacterium]
MTKKIHLLMLLVLVTMFSCTSEELDFPQSEASVEQSNENLITAEQASQYALDFVNKINKATRTSDFSLRVESVKAIGENKKSTRSGSASNCDSLFYIVNFADNNGYAIVSTDRNDTHVYGYVEEGTYDEDDTNDSGFSDYMSSIIASRKNKASSSLANVGCNGGSACTRNIGFEDFDEVIIDVDVFDCMQPLLKCKWSQAYNKYCPKIRGAINKTLFDPSRCVTGCMPTAISQVCSFLEWPKEFSYNDENGRKYDCKIDWKDVNDKNVKNEGKGFSKTDSVGVEPICHLMRYWGVQFGAKYGKTTSTNPFSAIKKMKELGYNVTEFVSFDLNKVITDLQHERIVLVCGENEKEIGHAWVVDGYIIEGAARYLHCNWGCGGNYNGYFYIDRKYPSFDTNKPEYDDYGKKITRDVYDSFSLETSTIGRVAQLPSAPSVTGANKRAEFLANTRYDFYVSYPANQQVCETEWIIRYGFGDVESGNSDHISFVTGSDGIVWLRVRVRNACGWSEYTSIRGYITTKPGHIM